MVPDKLALVKLAFDKLALDKLLPDKFEYDKLDLNSKKFRGSTNQNYIEIKKVRLNYHI